MRTASRISFVIVGHFTGIFLTPLNHSHVMSAFERQCNFVGILEKLRDNVGYFGTVDEIRYLVVRCDGRADRPDVSILRDVLERLD
jgi:hypothetical protein